MKQTLLSGRRPSARKVALTSLLTLSAVLACLGEAKAQWATNGNDIHTTNTGNVGVGTTTPTNGKVEIVSDTGVTSGEHSFLYASRSGTSSGGFRFGYRANGTAVTGGFIRSLANLPFFVGTTGSPLALTIDNSGNVGVGTTTPSQKLSVLGMGAFYNSTPVQPSGVRGLFMGNFSVGSSIWSYDYVAGAADPLQVSAQDISLNTYVGGNGVTRLYVNNAGNVGVGTTTPGAKLDVRGNLILDAGASPNLYTGAAAAELNRYLHVLNSPGHSSASGLKAGGLLVADDYGYAHPAKTDVVVKGRVGIGTAGAAAYKLDVAGSVNSSGLCLGGDCKTAWSQVGGAGSQWMTSGTSINYNTGNVGIGVSAPTAILDAQRAETGDLLMRLWNTSTASGAATFRIANSSNAGGRLQFSDSAYYVSTVVADRVNGLRFRTGNAASEAALSDRIAILPDGKVGVGTASPVAGFDVQNPVNAVTAYGTRLQQSLTAGNNNAVLNALFINPTFVNGMAVGVRHNALVTGAGNIGFGTSATSAGLDVQNAGVYESGPNTAIGTRFQQVLTPNNNAISTGVLINPIFSDGMAVGVRHNGLVVAAGDVGIGTSTPSAKLDVQGGQINASGGLCIAGVCKANWTEVGGQSQWASGAGSSINYVTGNVGVGVASPAAKLHVAGGARLEGTGRVYLGAVAANGARGLELVEESATTFSIRHHDPNVAWRNIALSPYGGNVGVGTVNPLGPLSVGDASVTGSDGFVVIGKKTSVGTRQMRMGYDANFNFVIGDYGNGNVAGPWTSAFAINWQAPSNSFFVGSTGNVGVGTASPSSKLDVNGNVSVTGDITATGNIAAKYQDLAEWVPSTQRLQAGTVVVLDRARSNHVLASTEAYDTGVAGVVSVRPGIILGEGGDDKLMVATTGRVKVRVDATRAPIQIGDLIVTSEVEGVAMKSEPISIAGRRIHAPGTIIGKALEPLAKGTGEILVLLSLQ